MERKNFGYSMKNIGIPSRKEYCLQLISSITQFTNRLRWRAHFFKNPNNKKQKETFGFNSLEAPPPVPELKPLENGLLQIVQNLKFRDNPGRNEFQQKLRKDNTEIRNERKLIIPADKTSNFYKMDKEEYKTNNSSPSNNYS